MTTGVIKLNHKTKYDIKGEAMVTDKPISFLGGVNTTTGVFIDESYSLYGQCFAGKIIVYPSGKGSTGDMLRIVRCQSNGVAPLAVINSDPDIIQVEGWIFAGIPVVFGCDQDPTKVLKTGDRIHICGDTITFERDDDK